MTETNTNGLTATGIFNIILISLVLALAIAQHYAKVEVEYQDPIISKIDSLLYANKVKDSIIYELYQENRQLKTTNQNLRYENITRTN